MVGFRLGARKTARVRNVRALRGDLQLLSERISTGSGTLVELVSSYSGVLFETIAAYLDALSEGGSETEAAEHALLPRDWGESEREGIRMFLTGLSGSTRSDSVKRAQALSATLERVAQEAETEAKQARVLRVSGVLAGAGLAILLL